MNILVVEDEPAVRDLVRRALELKGYLRKCLQTGLF
jgi:DNA-binding response OmpR family regulator